MLPGLHIAPMGAGGIIGEPWTPAAISPYAWYDAELSPKTVVSGNVSQWNDLSGNGRHITQSTSGNRPSYSAADKWIEFGANKLMGGQVLLPLGNGEWTVAAVFRIPTVPVNNGAICQVWKQGNATNNQGVELGVGVWGGPYNRIGFMYTNQNVGATGPNIASNTDYIVVWRRTTSKREIWVNGVQVLDNSYSAANLGSANYHFGNNASDSVSGTTRQRTNLVWREALSTVSRQRAEGYLAWLWGLQASLPSDHPYRYNPPVIVPGGPAQSLFTTTGVFTVPAGVEAICAVAVGAGGYRGGDLRYRNAIPVTPGETLNVTISTSGGPTELKRGGTTLLAARGGLSGTSTATGGDVGGGNGGNGGTNTASGVGGGGAGGYAGNGGNSAAAGSGGAGAGGRNHNGNGGGGGGGGVGLMGQGSNGAAGGSNGSGGGGGSGGGSGANGGAGGSGRSGHGGNGGMYGGGAGEAGQPDDDDDAGNQGTGGPGGLRIIWGAGRAFPSTNTGDV